MKKISDVIEKCKYWTEIE